jgi:preprotein translocase subunit SecD
MKKKNLLTRVIIIAIVTITGLYLVIGPRNHRPTPSDFKWSGIKATLKNNIHLGLDLQGGSHLVMRVKTEEFLRRLTEENYVAAQNAAKDAGIEPKGGRADTNPGNYRVVLQLADASKAADAKAAIEKKIELGDTNVWSYSASGDTLTWSMTASAERTLADNATTQALNIIESRINALGITEPTLQTHGAQSSHQILLQMPGVQDPERVKEILKGESRLELVHVVSPPNPSPATQYASEAEAIASLNSGGTVPPNRKVLPYSERIEKTADANKQRETRWVVVEVPAIIDGSELRNASAIPAQGGRADDYEINFSLKKSGADKFGAWTGSHINEYMGVVLNGEVKSVAFIKSQIFDSGQISGRFTKQSAEDLALTLRSGALPAHRWPKPRAGLDQGGRQSVTRRTRPRRRLHALLLSRFRRQRRRRIDSEHDPDACRTDRVWRDANSSRHRRYHFNDWYGGRLERAHLRAYSRRIALRQDDSVFRRSRI